MAPGGVEPPHAASKAAALSAELRGRRAGASAYRRHNRITKSQVSASEASERRGRDESRSTASAGSARARPQRFAETRARKSRICMRGTRVADGTRTRDHRDHNPGLYQLSYRHRAATEDTPDRRGTDRAEPRPADPAQPRHADPAEPRCHRTDLPASTAPPTRGPGPVTAPAGTRPSASTAPPTQHDPRWTTLVLIQHKRCRPLSSVAGEVGRRSR